MVIIWRYAIGSFLAEFYMSENLALKGMFL